MPYTTDQLKDKLIKELQAEHVAAMKTVPPALCGQWASDNLVETRNLLVLLALSIRCIVSLYPYSGHEQPPMFGDFEAQRHWQEITVNLPVARWYENGTDNDLQYWGLDYPPLTAYHSFAMGRFAQQHLNASFVRLHESRGLTSDAHKTFMRYTVLLVDVVIYLPVMWLIARMLHGQRAVSSASTVPDYGLRLVHFGVLALFPGQLLIDNGHFQYNNVSLGLSALAVWALCGEQLLLACAAFTLALNYKQMCLYHALPVFVFLLRRCVPEAGSFCGGRFFGRLAAKASVVLGLFAVLWWPWLGSVESALQVVHRVFPVARGVFEDKVANVWCVLNVVVPLKQLVANGPMAVICVSLTLLAAAPSLWTLWRRPRAQTLLLCLVNVSLAFFLLSFQVHEKTILLVALPVAIYFPLDPLPCLIFLQTATFSMAPLLGQDRLIGAAGYVSAIYLACLFALCQSQLRSGPQTLLARWDVLSLGKLFVYRRDGPGIADLLGWTSGDRSALRWRRSLLVAFYATLIVQAGLVYALVSVRPPPALPHLMPLLISVVSAGYFGVFFVYFSVKLMLLGDGNAFEAADEKHLHAE